MAKKPDVEVIERVDPVIDSAVDGDPAFEAMLESSSVPSDLHPVWVHVSDVMQYKGQRYREAYPSDGIKLLCGLEFEGDEKIQFRDHVLMVRDREYHQKRREGELSGNRKLRSRMLSKKRLEGEHQIQRR